MNCELSEPAKARIEAHITNIYGPDAAKSICTRVFALCEEHAQAPDVGPGNKWSENDTILITYGDTIRKEGQKHLDTLQQFLAERLADVVSGVHILPFFPYTSDDGFSVVDYLEVDEPLGGWQHVRRIGQDFDLMVDLVINHVSRKSEWFRQFQTCESPGKAYFISLPPNTDVAEVVRPRSHPLLAPVETAEGTKHVWATFSADQIDVDFANPDVLIEYLKIIAFYLQNGAQFIRLDAVGFLWKELGTSCIHLPQTHEVVKLIRLFAELINPLAVIITETNVPNRENLSYFGNLNEAHMIYNFSLPPLMLDALLRGDSQHLMTWMMSMPPAPFGCAYLNFTASHDGIGLRPAEGLMSDEEIAAMITTVKRCGGEISMRRKNGQESPYEMNISLWSALQGTHEGPDEWQFDRFVCSQIIMMSLEGVPGIYIHTLLGTENNHEAYQRTGQKRALNRRKWQYNELTAKLDDDNLHHGRVFKRISELLQIRRRQGAFHPNATQYTLHLGSRLFGFWRQSMLRDQSIFVICNVTALKLELSLSELNLVIVDPWCDLIDGQRIEDIHQTLELAPYQCMWLTNKF
jgi:sucrose phosphorylase